MGHAFVVTGGVLLAGAGVAVLSEPGWSAASSLAGALVVTAVRCRARRRAAAPAPSPRPGDLLPTAPVVTVPTLDRHGLGVSPIEDGAALGAWRAHRDRLAAELEAAVAAGALRLAFQPIVDLASCEAVAFEAALHWQRVDGHVALPDELTAVAEESGAAVRIGRWLVEESCRQLARWNDSWPDRAPLSLHVGVSTRLVVTSNLAAHVEEVVVRHRVEPECLVLQVAESALAVRTPVLAQLEAVRRLGVRVALSGYGTGATSLTHLASLPIDTMKIDRGFVADLGSLTNDATIIGGLVALGHAFGLQVLADGIDSDVQLSMVQKLGCDLAQGRYLAQPMSAARADDIVRDRTMYMPDV